MIAYAKQVASRVEFDFDPERTRDYLEASVRRILRDEFPDSGDPAISWSFERGDSAGIFEVSQHSPWDQIVCTATLSGDRVTDEGRNARWEAEEDYLWVHWCLGNNRGIWREGDVCSGCRSGVGNVFEIEQYELRRVQP